MGTRPYFLPLVCLLTGLLVITGCGGGNTNLTKAEFVREGNKICVKGAKERVARAQQALRTLPAKTVDVEERDRILARAVVPSFRRTIAELRELSPPEAQKEKVNTILNHWEAYLDRVEKGPAQASSDLDLRTRALGLTACTE